MGLCKKNGKILPMSLNNQNRSSWSLGRIIFWIIVFALVGGYFVYPQYYRPFFERLNPNKCLLPLQYNIGEVDKGFGLSRADFDKSVTQAINYWQSFSTSTKMFVKASTTSAMPINLIYDNRQAATKQLDAASQRISEGRATLDEIKQAYIDKKAEYDKAKATYEAHVAEYNSGSNAYISEVSSWNKKGGAPKSDYDRLNELRIRLENNTNILETEANNLNALGQEVNRLALLANQSITEINKNVTNYNSSDLIGKEFEQGLYKVSGLSRSIDIYQFSTPNKLYKVLVHELGHALGLGHNPDKLSVMYYVNQDTKQVITKADITQALSNCREADMFDKFIDFVLFKPIIWLKTRISSI